MQCAFMSLNIFFQERAVFAIIPAEITGDLIILIQPWA